MTVKKALQLTDWFLQNNTTLCKGLLDPGMPWNKDDLLKKLSITLVDMLERDSKILRSIRRELVGNCKHPKKMHDICKGQKYCMACNMDL